MRPAILLLGLLPLLPLGAQSPAGTFVPAEVCSDCHSRLYPPGVEPNWKGMGIVHRGEAATPVDPRSVAPAALWPASMMAHAAIDPYWQAKVRYEAAETPAAAAVIENTCLSCHAPMQQYDRRGGSGLRLAELDAAGREGVSCTVCHQIEPASLGKPESISAGFRINTRREIYGPHENPFPMPMRMHTGRTPTHSAHMLQSELCGTCHTLVTPVLDATGQKTGEFLEQATYLEWAASLYPKSGRSCQSCHLPLLADGEGKPVRQYIAHTPHGGYFGPIRPREPFGQHTFGAANVQMARMLADLNPGKAEILGLAANRARRMLEEGLGLELTAVRRGRLVEAEVRVVNAAGHKFPSGFPSRRLWLHLKARDAAGAIRFESGAWNPATGEIRSLEGRAGAAMEPHHARITRPDQTQIYEAEMAAPGGAATASLLRAGRWSKDNRLLPLGFAESEGARHSLSPVGVTDDADFRAGGDTVVYQIPAGPDGGAGWTIEVEALYQSIKPAHTRLFDAGRSREEAAFLKVFAGERRAPVVVAGRSVTVD